MITQSITIHQLIVHRIYHKRFDKPTLYDLESPLDDALTSMLRKQIADNLKHKYTSRAMFEDVLGGQKRLRDICDELLDNQKNFIPKSREIAQRLFDASNQTTSESDLVVCTFSEGANAGLKWLALLKMDPQSGMTEEEKGQAGKKMIVLKPVVVLPTGYLQKCAFILPTALRQTNDHKKTDLYILDFQVGNSGSQQIVVSSFFKEFLQCRVDLTRADLTTAFVRGSHDWVSKKENQWPEEDIIRFEEQTQATVRDEEVDLTEFAVRVISKPAEQQEYLSYMQEKKGVTNLVFKPDPTRRAELQRYVWYEGDNDLLVRVSTQAKDSVLKTEKLPGQPYKITITTSTWNPKYGKRH